MLNTQNIIDKLKNQGIEADTSQIKLITELVDLNIRKKGFIEPYLTKNIKKSGIYIWGDVGRGKTLVSKTYLQSITNKNVKYFKKIIKPTTEELKQQLNEAINNSNSYSQRRHYRNQLQNAKALVQEQGAITVADYTMKNFLALLRPGTRGTAKIPSSIFALSGVRGGDEEVESPQIYLKFGLLISLSQSSKTGLDTSQIFVSGFNFLATPSTTTIVF